MLGRSRIGSAEAGERTQSTSRTSLLQCQPSQRPSSGPPRRSAHVCGARMCPVISPAAAPKAALQHQKARPAPWVGALQECQEKGAHVRVAPLFTVLLCRGLQHDLLLRSHRLVSAEAQAGLESLRSTQQPVTSLELLLGELELSQRVQEQDSCRRIKARRVVRFGEELQSREVQEGVEPAAIPHESACHRSLTTQVKIAKGGCVSCRLTTFRNSQTLHWLSHLSQPSSSRR